MKFKQIGAAVGISLIAASPAFAGTLDQPVVEPMVFEPAPAPAPVAQRGEWTGAYVGLQLGYGDLTADDGATELEADGTLYGVHAGYMHDFGSYVLGGEFDYDATEIEDAAIGGTVDSVARLKMRAGYDMGAILPYATAGAAYADASDTALNGSDNGYFIGGGVDYRVTDNVVVGGEILQHRFNDFNDTGFDLDVTTVTARVGFQF